MEAHYPRPSTRIDEMAHLLHETLGKNEGLHIHFGYNGDIIRPVVFEQFPKGWEERLVPVPGVEHALCLDPHDMAAAKCQAGRPKDIELLVLLFTTGRLKPDLVRERLREVPMREAMIVTSHRVLDEAIRRSAGEC